MRLPVTPKICVGFGQHPHLDARHIALCVVEIAPIHQHERHGLPWLHLQQLSAQTVPPAGACSPISGAGARRYVGLYPVCYWVDNLSCSSLAHPGWLLQHGCDVGFYVGELRPRSLAMPYRHILFLVPFTRLMW